MTDKILVVSGPSYASAVRGLGTIVNSVDSFINNPEDFLGVLFTGGADVAPELYGEESPSYMCYTNPHRDQIDLKVFRVALKHDKLMFGICRGLQFLNVMSGGKLVHHLDGHEGAGNHNMQTTTDGVIRVNSLHHQMVVPHQNAIITAWAQESKSKVYIGNNDLPFQYKGVEVEAAIFPKIKGFGVQYHPEMMSTASSGYSYFYDMAAEAVDSPWEKFTSNYMDINNDADKNDGLRCSVGSIQGQDIKP